LGTSAYTKKLVPTKKKIVEKEDQIKIVEITGIKVTLFI